MDKREAKSIQLDRNKARKNLAKYKRLLWKTSFGDPAYKVYQERYDQAAADLENSSLTYKQALRLFI